MTNNKGKNWKNMKAIFMVSMIALLFATIATSAPSQNYAPVQNAIKQAITDGNFSIDDLEGSPKYNVEILEKNDTHIKLISTTKITFKNPRGAGFGKNTPKYAPPFPVPTSVSTFPVPKDDTKDKWPKFQIPTNGKSTMINKSNAIEDYDQQIKNSILAEINNISNATERNQILEEWNNYSFESGARTFEFNETYEAIYLNNSAGTFVKTLPIEEMNINSADILMGFTTPIYWTYSKQENLYFDLIIWHPLIAWAKVDAVLDAALGLRLPTTVSLNKPDIMNRGQSYNLETNINGQDWDATKYSVANVPPENGNEFIARGKASITLQAWARIIGDIGPYSLYDKNFDYGRSFQTPFGPNQEFPISELYLSPDQTGLKIYCCSDLLWGGIGLKIDPDLGSDKITANWNADGDSIGSGSTEYNMPNTNYNFGPVIANDYSTTTDNANIRLSDYKYYFTICRLTLGANIQGGLTFTSLNIQTDYIDLYTYNCGDMTGDHYIGIHQGTTANSLTGVSIVPTSPIDKIAPITTISGVTEGGIYNSDVTITLTATDNQGGSGVKHIDYNIIMCSIHTDVSPIPTSVSPFVPSSGGGGCSSAGHPAYATPFKVSGIGIYNITFWSTDNAGNIEPYKTLKFTISSSLDNSTISIKSPQTGDIWQPGSKQTIRWDYTGNAGSTVNIDLYKGETFIKRIKTNIPIGNRGKGSIWNLDKSRPSGNDYWLKITSNSGITGKSDYFTIGNGSVPPTTLTAIRTISMIGNEASVTVTIKNDGTSRSLSLREIIPQELTFTRTSDNADQFKAITNEWVWLSIPGNTVKTVKYKVTMTSGSSKTYNIDGEITTNGIATSVTGDKIISATEDIFLCYRRLGQFPDIVETSDLMNAADDWRNDIVRCSVPITTAQLLELATEWRNS